MTKQQQSLGGFMALNPQDKALLQQLADQVVTQIIPQAIADAEQQLPSFYAGLVNLVVTPLLGNVEAQLKAWVDSKIASM